MGGIEVETKRPAQSHQVSHIYWFLAWHSAFKMKNLDWVPTKLRLVLRLLV